MEPPRRRKPYKGVPYLQNSNRETPKMNHSIWNKKRNETQRANSNRLKKQNDLILKEKPTKELNKYKISTTTKQQ
jgi:5-methylcytosine-specific restriction endonuclease McrA